MKYILGLLLALCVTSAEAQSTVKVCYPTGNGNSCQDVTLTHPLPVTGSLTATVASPLTVTASQPFTITIDTSSPGVTDRVVSGFSQQVADTPTITTSAYITGNCIGGFRSITVAQNNGQTGLLTNFRIGSIAGLTPTIVAYGFTSQPTTSTCTDRSTFTLSAADFDKLIFSPSSGTLAVPANATTPTTIGLDFTPPRPFIAGGSISSGIKTIYYALVAASSFTPTTTTDLHTSTGVALD